MAVLITGCGSGIGLHTALAFGRQGHLTYATVRNPHNADTLREHVAKEDLPVEILPLDVTDDESVAAAVAHVEKRHRAVAILVNNAGVISTGPVETMPMEQARPLMETNFWGPVRLARAVLPAMRQHRSGVIVNINSLAGLVPGFMHSAFYSAAKHALSVLTESLACEVASLGVRVLSIDLGPTATQIHHGVTTSAHHTDAYHADVRWANEFLVRSIKSGSAPAHAADTIMKTALDPHSPLHTAVGDTAAHFIQSARSAQTFEQWLAWAVPLAESVAGPRPPTPAGD
ncbi:SDR family oxidoreductase [Streptomyces turgidiscabies]|uniref:NAD(P)-dependent dehydrogenase (Short-subunit alcohol dehydrogenase family) n=1 Tax=Streptomyces turgidiscabies TaxID=85558 RepID=A0ABU0RTC7_9ACTN|nr:SDR family oxidoreductase [Streptomyces turgidiscabies]MDQ0935247.1 NAD(P)-dependent dehydrogenase (short-subunit alcohol dehydrogenase family) [Streptomyces turgidiscabies]